MKDLVKYVYPRYACMSVDMHTGICTCTCWFVCTCIHILYLHTREGLGVSGIAYVYGECLGFRDPGRIRLGLACTGFRDM